MSRPEGLLREAADELAAGLADLGHAVELLEAAGRFADAGVLTGHFVALEAGWRRLEAGESLGPDVTRDRPSTGGAV